MKSYVEPMLKIDMFSDVIVTSDDEKELPILGNESGAGLD